MIETDICIIGAGPAGAATSLTLSKMKIPHVILDAAVFPRDKVCGDVLDTTTMRVLNSIEPGCVEKEILSNDNFKKSEFVVIHVNEKKKTVINVSSNKTHLNYPAFCSCKRSYFDNFLVNKIDPQYAQFLQGAKVEKILHEKDHKTIFVKQNNQDIQIKVKLVVGADGDHSVVQRSLGNRKINREHYAVALRQYWTGVSGLQDGHVEAYFPKSLPYGYFWIFPMPNGEANVGLIMQSSIAAKNSVDLKKVMTDLIQHDPVLMDRFKNATPLETMKGYGLPYASLQRNIYGNGWLLVGDAASLVCPTTGEGIGPAMMSGYIAAHFIQQSIQKNDFTADIFRLYEREVLKRMQVSIKVYQFLLKTSPKLYSFFLNYVVNNSFITKKISDHFTRKIELAYTEKIPVDLAN